MRLNPSGLFFVGFKRIVGCYGGVVTTILAINIPNTVSTVHMTVVLAGLHRALCCHCPDAGDPSGTESSCFQRRLIMGAHLFAFAPSRRCEMPQGSA